MTDVTFVLYCSFSSYVISYNVACYSHYLSFSLKNSENETGSSNDKTRIESVFESKCVFLNRVSANNRYIDTENCFLSLLIQQDKPDLIVVCVNCAWVSNALVVIYRWCSRRDSFRALSARTYSYLLFSELN